MMLTTLPRGGAVLSNGLQGKEVGRTVCDATLESGRVGEGLKVVDDDDIREEVDRYVVFSVLDDAICLVVDDVKISDELDDVICEETDDIICVEVCEGLAKDVSEVVKSSVVKVLLCITDDCAKSRLVTELELGTVLVETAEVLETGREVVCSAARVE